MGKACDEDDGLTVENIKGFFGSGGEWDWEFWEMGITRGIS